jgi:hypothetical protein
MVRSACLLLLGAMLASRVAWAGAWTQAPGATFAKVSWLSQTASQRWGCRGGSLPADPAGDFVSHQVFGYVEHGLRSRLTILGSFAYKDQRIDGQRSYGTRSTGDLRMGARLGLVQGPRPVSVEAVLSVPTYPRSDLGDPVAERKQFLPAGSGRVEAEVHALAGISLFPLPLYGNLDLGYRERGGGFSDQWLAAVELGASSTRLFAKAELRWAWPDTESCEEGAVGAVALHERLVQVAPEVAVRVTRSWWVSLGYAQPLSGRNALDGGQWSLGLLLRAGGG